jgi:hypothetical protein
MKPMPSLAGTERLRAQRHNWDCAGFSAANTYVLKLMAARKWARAANAENEFIEQFKQWNPSNGPH